MDKERKKKLALRARREGTHPPRTKKKKRRKLLTNSPTTLNGCPLSRMLRPFLISAVVAVPARTCLCVCAMNERRRKISVTSRVAAFS